MKYIIREGKYQGEYNATNKARNDADAIAIKSGYKPLEVPTQYGVNKNKIKQFCQYGQNKKIWMKTLKKLQKGDLILIQYPLINTTLHFHKIIKKYQRKGVHFVLLIHDLDSLRYKKEIQGKFLYQRVYQEDHLIPLQADYVIAHNPVMKEKLMDMGVRENKIYILNLFDYLLDHSVEQERKKTDGIIIAGNLSVEKAGFLKYLPELKKINFELYGANYSLENSDNIFYHGKFLPEELVDEMKGSFGLVWDGESTFSCTGGFGDYLKYNNPHKASLYLTCGLPIIVWDHSALASFVLENNVGFTVERLSDIETKLKEISLAEYEEMVSNAKEIAKKTSTGQFLQTILEKIEL